MPKRRESLSPLEQRFVKEFQVDLNGTQAALRAGYSPKTARQLGARLLSKVGIQAAIAVQRQAQAQRIDISADRTIFEAARLAFYDLRKVYAADGTLKKIHDIDDDTAAALQGIETIEEYDAKGLWTGRVRKVRMAPKLPAVKLVGQHLGAFQRGGLSGEDITFLEQLLTLILRHVHDASARSEIAGFLQGYVSGAGPRPAAPALGAGGSAA